MLSIALIILVVAGVTMLIKYEQPGRYSSTNTKSKTIDRHFTKAIEYMQQRQYEQAVAEWHKLMLLNPDIPEVQVNMGFSLFELGKYETARDFFVSAMERYSFQANAYYGLAIVSEQLGDMEGAMGAMRSYIHLAKDNDKFIRKARSALWEWERQLEAKRKSEVDNKQTTP